MEMQKFLTTSKVPKKNKWFDLEPIIASCYEQTWKAGIITKV